MPKAATPLPHLSKDDFEARGKDLEEAEKAREEKEAAKRANSQARQEVEAVESEKVSAATAQQKSQKLPTPPIGRRGRILGVLAGLAGVAAAASLRGSESSATGIGEFHPTNRALDAACPPLLTTDESPVCEELKICLTDSEDLSKIAACAQSEGISIGAAANKMMAPQNWYTDMKLREIDFKGVNMAGFPGLFGQRAPFSLFFQQCDLSEASFTGSTGILRLSTDTTPCIGADFRNVTAVISDRGTSSFSYTAVSRGGRTSDPLPVPSDNTFRNANFNGADVTFDATLNLPSPRRPFLLTDFTGATFDGATVRLEGITPAEFQRRTIGLDLRAARYCYADGVLVDCPAPLPPPIPTPPIPTPPTPTRPPAADQTPPANNTADSLLLGIGSASVGVGAVVLAAAVVKRHRNRAAAAAAVGAEAGAGVRAAEALGDGVEIRAAEAPRGGVTGASAELAAAELAAAGVRVV